MNIRKQLTPKKLIELHIRENLSLSEIGELYGVSRQRIHQLKKEYEKEQGKITRRVVIDALTLKHYLEQGWTAKRIAEHLELRPSKVSRMIRKYKEEYEAGYSPINIHRKKADDIVTKEELYHLYIHQLYTDKEIAEKFQVSPSTINLLRKKYGIKTIKTKSLRRLPSLLSKEKFIELYIHQGYTLKKIADLFQCNIVSIIKLKEEYNIKKKR
jgi:predicted DNA-binding protein YlxM (UPF0122 family)